MSGKLSGWNDTIAALATPQGIGAIGIIRISGVKTFPVVNALFTSKDILNQTSHTLHVGFLEYDDKVIDEVVLSLFRSPRSYTGEDVIEISCHGSAYIQQKILDILFKHDIRPARPGEFTQRAFINGKLDLMQAEAVADLIASNTEASRKTAMGHMRGGFSKTLKDIREKLVQFSALIELELDFSQEDVEFADRKKLLALLLEAKENVEKLLQSFQSGNVIKNGVEVAIIGKPNAGKSTLLNTLLNEDRAIVSEIAGTTRDTIEETIHIDGILFRLVDTAGIRESTGDIIEVMGVEKSLHKMRNADIVLYLFDANEMAEEELTKITGTLKTENKNLLFVGNKSDILSAEKIAQKFSFSDSIIFISAKNEINIDELKKALFARVVNGNIFSNETIITNVRHAAALQKVQESLVEILNGLESKIPADLIALDIRRCLHYIGDITGEVTNEEQLDYIFSKFCIGK